MVGLKRDQKSGRFVKPKCGGLVKRGRKVFSVLCVGLVVVQLLVGVIYCMFTDRTVEFCLKNGGLYVQMKDSDRGAAKLMAQAAGSPKLANTEYMVSKKLLDEKDEQIRCLTVAAQDLTGQLKRYRSSVWHCCSVIAADLSQSLSIDTNQSCQEEHTVEVYKSVQRLLGVLGHGVGDVDGDQGRTHMALQSFQGTAGLEADGKLGRQTWKVMVCEIAEIIAGEKPHRSP